MYSTETPPDPVGEIVILRRRHRRRQVADPKFFEARQKALLLLTAKHPEYEFGGVRRPAPRHHGQNEAGEIGVVEFSHAAPFQPLRFARAALTLRSCLLLDRFLLAASIYQSGLRPNLSAPRSMTARCKEMTEWLEMPSQGDAA